METILCLSNKFGSGAAEASPFQEALAAPARVRLRADEVTMGEITNS
jgi:hypothetical protein